MINMMYLVLTALLALNVSAEILNAFQLIDNSLIKTTKNIETKNTAVYDKFEAFMAVPASAAKAKEWKDKADNVKSLTEKLLKYVTDKNNEIVLASDGTLELYKEHGIGGIAHKDDNNTPAEIMILKGGGNEFKGKLNKYRDELIAIIDASTKGKNPEIIQNGESIKKTLMSIFDTKDVEGHEGDIVPWDVANFEHMPLAAVVTLFDKFATDIRNAESDVINFCIGQVEAGTWKFNKLEAIVNSPTNYVMIGGEYKAEVFIAASDSTQKPNILAGGRHLRIENGKGIYTGGTGSAGVKKWGGVIRLKSPVTGDTVEYKYNSEYQVVVPSVSVSPTKMNVFYIGVRNPVDVTAAGVPVERLKVSMSGGGGGKIVKSGKGYIVTVRSVTGKNNLAKINVTADGKSLGTKKFRCKRVPDPSATIGSDRKNWKGGVMAQSRLIALGRVNATMENFDFDLRFKVTSYTILTNIGGFDETIQIRGNTISPQAKNLIRKAKRKSRVIFEQIKAKGPDGTQRKLNDIVIKLR